jgi:hypothetical protein
MKMVEQHWWVTTPFAELHRLVGQQVDVRWSSTGEVQVTKAVEFTGCIVDAVMHDEQGLRVRLLREPIPLVIGGEPVFAPERESVVTFSVVPQVCR